jgi:hypothetical protein
VRSSKREDVIAFSKYDVRHLLRFCVGLTVLMHCVVFFFTLFEVIYTISVCDLQAALLQY